MIDSTCRRIAAWWVLLLSCGTALAGPGHYVVVEIDDAGQAQPVFYRRVDLQGRLAPDAAAFARAAMHPEQVAISGKGWRQVAEVPRFIRGEFAANGVDGEIVSHEVRSKQRSFALRIPARAGNRLKLDFMGIASELQLDRIAGRADFLPLARLGKSQSLAAANAGNRVDILVLGDGYTTAEQATFASDAENLRASMFGMTPYK